MYHAIILSNEHETIFLSHLPLLRSLKSSVIKLVNDFVSNFMELDYVRSIGLFTELNPYLSSEYLPLNQIYMGIAATPCKN